MVSPLLGAGVALGTKFIPNFRVWNLENLDSNEIIQGQFHAEGLQEDVTANWGEFTSLNRQKPIMQFLHGNADQVSFTGRFYKSNVLGLDLNSLANPVDAQTPENMIKKLKSWARIEENLRRPPILQFWVGDGHLRLDCVLLGVTGIAYARPDIAGGLRDVSFNVSLREFSTFSLDDVSQTDTRYARAKERDYYEMLAFEEYGDPLFGDAVRKDHPDQDTLRSGDIVRLPSIEGIRQKTITQTSISLKTAFNRKDTPQRRLRLDFFDKRSGSYVSHVLQPATTPNASGG